MAATPSTLLEVIDAWGRGFWELIPFTLQMALVMLVTAPIMGIGGVILALREDVTLSWILVVIVPLIAAVIATLMYFAVPLFQSMQGKIDKINDNYVSVEIAPNVTIQVQKQAITTLLPKGTVKDAR